MNKFFPIALLFISFAIAYSEDQPTFTRCTFVVDFATPVEDKSSFTFESTDATPTPSVVSLVEEGANDNVRRIEFVGPGCDASTLQVFSDAGFEGEQQSFNLANFPDRFIDLKDFGTEASSLKVVETSQDFSPTDDGTNDDGDGDAPKPFEGCLFTVNPIDPSLTADDITTSDQPFLFSSTAENPEPSFPNLADRNLDNNVRKIQFEGTTCDTITLEVASDTGFSGESQTFLLYFSQEELSS